MPRPPADDGVISCASCTSPMAKISLGGVTIDRCAACGGIWVDGGELRAILDSGKAGRRAVAAIEGIESKSPEHRPNPLLCPRDRQRMSVHRDPRQTHIEYDLCPKCGGVFFDAGELADLTDFTLAERLKGMMG